jgi:hypothetical protein
MSRSLTSSACRLRAGWFWPLVLVALPNCTFDPQGVSNTPNLVPGPTPRTTLIFCDVERPLQRHCATVADKALGVRLSEAALALNTGRTSVIGLDDSPAALARCGGEPEAVPFLGAFPEGQPTCVNPTKVGDGATYANPREVCVALCEDMFGSTDAQGSFTPDNPPGPGVASFCNAHAHASTNVSFDPGGVHDGCTPDGGEDPAFDTPSFPDERRNPEPVEWTDRFGVVSDFNSLTRLSPSTGNFDAGAASDQFIARGDGYVEFSGAETNLSHVAGLSEVNPGPLGCSFNNCVDRDPSLNDINAAISLNVDGRFYVIESGNLVPGPDVNGSFGTYAAGDRFRVMVKDNQDGTASVVYSKVLTPCHQVACPDTPFLVSARTVQYPVRVDTSFREAGATLQAVTLVRIH